MDSSRLTTEIAHVLFMDLVGYSLLPMEEQARLTAELRGIVRQTQEFQRAAERGELISLDLGDGLALVFFRDPVAPVQCAVETARKCSEHPNLRLRMGIHSGPVSRTQDINGKENVSGGGINSAQRVMSCGDAGHILLSRSSAEFMRQFESWAGLIHPLGECQVKHGEVIDLFNLYVEGAGSSSRPSSMSAAGPAERSTYPQIAPLSGAAGTSLGIAILYKRNAQPDERLLRLLEERLALRGHRVFVDRHMAIGVEWATEIERQIRGSDAVVPLLSQSSIHSEMLDYEVSTANNAAAQNRGKPRILPVRVQFTGPLRDSLAAILDPLHYSLWEGPQDDERVLGELVRALESPAESAQPLKPERLEPLGGAVPLDSEFYIVRPTDDEFKEAIRRQDSIVLVKGVRQMGKTSLLARGLSQARDAGARIVLTDFQTLNAVHLESPEALYLTLAEMIADQLDLETSPTESWSSSRGPNMNLERFIRREVLGSVDAPVVWGMDEVDRLFSCPFGSEVFGLFRSWHNRRSLDPGGPWARLTLAIAYATEAHLFITDLNQSPFNVGTRLTLDDFTREQVRELNRRYGAPIRSDEELSRFYDLESGHPYLVRRGLDEMVSHKTSFDAFAASADRDEGPYGDHLRRLLISLSQDAELTEVVRSVLRGGTCPTAESFYRLRSAGVISGESAGDARLRCRLYQRYLERHLL